MDYGAIAEKLRGLTGGNGTVGSAAMMRPGGGPPMRFGYGPDNPRMSGGGWLGRAAGMFGGMRRMGAGAGLALGQQMAGRMAGRLRGMGTAAQAAAGSSPPPTTAPPAAARPGPDPDLIAAVRDRWRQ